MKIEILNMRVAFELEHRDDMNLIVSRDDRGKGKTLADRILDIKYVDEVEYDHFFGPWIYVTVEFGSERQMVRTKERIVKTIETYVAQCRRRKK